MQGIRKIKPRVVVRKGRFNRRPILNVQMLERKQVAHRRGELGGPERVITSYDPLQLEEHCLARGQRRARVDEASGCVSL